MEKLEKTNSLVEKLSFNMVLMQPQLEQANLDTITLGLKLERDKVDAAKTKARVEDEKKAVDKQTTEVQLQYNLALQELNVVMPALREAEEALDTLVRYYYIDSCRTNQT